MTPRKKINLKIQTKSKSEFNYSDPSKLSLSQGWFGRRLHTTWYHSSASAFLFLYRCLLEHKSSRLQPYTIHDGTRWLTALRRICCRNQSESCKCSRNSYRFASLPDDYGPRRSARIDEDRWRSVQAKFKPELDTHVACSTRINVQLNSKVDETAMFEERHGRRQHR